MSDELLPETPSQTAGPYVHIGLAPAVAGNPERDIEIWNVLARPEASGEHITLTGAVYDGNGDLVRDSFIEVWQADSAGNYQTRYDPEQPFNSLGRTATSLDEGEWAIETVKPGRVRARSGELMAPHVNLTLFARGINIHLQTRIYFDDEAEANAQCPVLKRITSLARRETLLARRAQTGGKPAYRFDIHLQGPRETVFFDY